jgi:hypothetical protein
MMGTELAAMGFLFKMLGLAFGRLGTSEDDKKVYQELEGRRNYSIKTPWGWYTVDWAQPIAVPFAIGVVLAESILNKRESGDPLDAKMVYDAIFAGTETVFNIGMLQNIKAMFGGMYGLASESFASIPLDFLEQAYPSMFGNIAKSIDPIQRTAYGYDFFTDFVKGLQSRTPFITGGLTEKVDVFGRPLKYYNPSSSEDTAMARIKNIIAQELSPGQFIGTTKDPVDLELIRLYTEIKDSDLRHSMIPNTVKEFSLNQKEYTLDIEEQVEFQKMRGAPMLQELRALMNTSRYKQAEDEVRAKMIKGIAEKQSALAKAKWVRNIK